MDGVGGNSVSAYLFLFLFVFLFLLRSSPHYRLIEQFICFGPVDLVVWMSGCSLVRLVVLLLVVPTQFDVLRCDVMRRASVFAL